MSSNTFQNLAGDVETTKRELRAIGTLLETEFQRVHGNISALKDDVLGVKDDVIGVKDDVQSFKIRFEEFVDDLEKKNNVTHAQGQIVILNQELEKQFGLYEKVRKCLLGILQSVDTGLVSKRAITEATEDLMLGTPRYWLTPSLIALAAWINNNKQLAEKALNEGLTRHQLKTVLIFTLISNRLKRRDASFMWLNKYFENQNPLEMPQETLILVNAYTDGVFGPDSQGECMVQIKSWLDYLSKQPEKVEALQENWIDRINSLQVAEDDNNLEIKYLPQFSKEYPLMTELLGKAMKNKAFLQYLERTMSAPKQDTDYITQLDNILYKLVEEYDSDEFELRKKRKLCELIIKYDGDKELAQQEFDANTVNLFKNKVTFFEILVNAVVKDSSSSSMRKLAITLMKEYITNAYNDFVARYRNNYPSAIGIEINGWKNTIKNGSESEDLAESYKDYLDVILKKALKKEHISYFAIGFLIGGLIWAIASNWSIVSLIFTVVSTLFLITNIICVKQNRNELIEKFNQDCQKGTNIIENLCAEYVDWQRAYKKADEKAKNVTEYLQNYNIQDFTENNADKKIIMSESEG